MGSTSGTLSLSNFRYGSTNRAHDADEHFIFRKTDDTLWFDADGNGAAKPLLIADLSNDFQLTNDFIYII